MQRSTSEIVLVLSAATGFLASIASLAEKAFDAKSITGGIATLLISSSLLVFSIALLIHGIGALVSIWKEGREQRSRPSD